MEHIDPTQVLWLVLSVGVLCLFIGIGIEAWLTTRWMRRERIVARGFACEEDREDFHARR